MDREEFIQAGGEADRGIPWRGGRLIFGKETAVILLTPGVRLGDELELETVLVPEHPRMQLQIGKHHLRPGETTRIFVESRNTSTIPGIAELYGRRATASWVFREGEVTRELEDKMRREGNPSTRKKAFKVPGPVVRPEGGTGLIDHLIAITTESYTLGWISSNDVFEGLMDKLTAAKAKIDEGVFVPAPPNVISAFRNQLAAQRDKAIEEACYWMLDICADELIKTLRD